MKLLKRIFLLLAVTIMYSGSAVADTPIAKVGNRIFTMEELRKTLNSTPYGMPSTGTPIDPGSRKIMLQMLAEMINAELLYGEARNLGTLESTAFKTEADRNRKGMLAGLYRKKLFSNIGKADPETVRKFAKEKSLPEEAAQALLQSESRKKTLAYESARLYEQYQVHYEPIVVQEEIGKLKNGDLMVSSSAFRITFGDVRYFLSPMGNTKSALIDLLAQTVEVELFSARAAEEGLDKDPSFTASVDEYEHDLAVMFHRAQLEKSFRPGDREIHSFLKRNNYLRYKPQTASILLIVVPTEKEANFLRKKALRGANFHELAMDHSIAPEAKSSAGKINPVSIGDNPYSTVDKAILALKPGEISPPIKGDKGYSLFKLLEITPREPRPDADKRVLAIHAITDMKMADHIGKLRMSTDVEIFPAFDELGKSNN